MDSAEKCETAVVIQQLYSHVGILELKPDIFGSAANPILLLILFLLGHCCSKKHKAPSFEIGSG